MKEEKNEIKGEKKQQRDVWRIKFQTFEKKKKIKQKK